MKVFAIGSLAPITPEQRKELMPTEAPNTLRLYLDGKIEQFWLRSNSAGTIFLMEVDSAEQARAALETLPLTLSGHMTFKFMPVGPLAALALLLPPK